MVPSVSVAVNADIGVAPAVEGMVEFVSLIATGGLLPTGSVIVAKGDTPPLLSIAVKVKISLPVKFPVGL